MCERHGDRSMPDLADIGRRQFLKTSAAATGGLVIALHGGLFGHEAEAATGAIKSTHPDYRYETVAGPEEVGDGGRIHWVSGRPGETPAYAGTDFIIARYGRIAAIYLFFDKLP